LSSGVTAVIHFAHAGLVIGGLVGVLLLLSPMAMRRRRIAIAELRDAAASGNLVRLAELRATGVGEADPAHERLRPELIVAILASLLAAGVHVWVCPEHFKEGLRFGLFFIVASLCQTGWAVWAAWRPQRWLFLAGIAGNIAMIVLWILTRSVGLPFGLAEVESVGGLDLAATIGEAVTVVACWACLGWGLRSRLASAVPAAKQLLGQST
jgi:hypothetical protein